MHHDVGAERERPREHRRRGGAVDREQRARRVRDLGGAGDVGDRPQRVGRRLDPASKPPKAGCGRSGARQCPSQRYLPASKIPVVPKRSVIGLPLSSPEAHGVGLGRESRFDRFELFRPRPEVRPRARAAQRAAGLRVRRGDGGTVAPGPSKLKIRLRDSLRSPRYLHPAGLVAGWCRGGTPKRLQEPREPYSMDLAQPRDRSRMPVAASVAARGGRAAADHRQQPVDQPRSEVVERQQPDVRRDVDLAAVGFDGGDRGIRDLLAGDLVV